MKKVTYILSLLLVCGVGISQTNQQWQDIDKVDVDSSVYQKDIDVNSKKAKFGVDLGMSYMFASGIGGGPSINFTPHVIYPLNQKFSLTAGLSMGTGQVVSPVFTEEEGLGYELLPMTRLFIYAGGNYKINEKTMVTGTVYKQVMDVPATNNKYGGSSEYNYEGMSMSINYKLTKNITIGAQVHVESSHNPWGNSRYYPVGNGYPGVW